jgi:hypothetical protein
MGLPPQAAEAKGRQNKHLRDKIQFTARNQLETTDPNERKFSG